MIARRDVLKGALAIGAVAMSGVAGVVSAATPLWHSFSFPATAYKLIGEHPAGGGIYNEVPCRQIIAVPGEDSAKDALARLLRDDPVWSKPGVRYEGEIFREIDRKGRGPFVGWRDIDGPPWADANHNA